MKKKFLLIVFFYAAFFAKQVSFAQIPNCDSLVPTFNINFTGPNAGTTWTSPFVMRNGTCCSAVAPDRCIDFVITTDSQTIGVCVAYCSYVPAPGSLICYIDCANPFGMSSAWTAGWCVDTGYISVPGVHYITFCKPGNNVIDYCVTSVTAPLPTSINQIEFIPLENNLSLNLSTPSSFSLSIFSADGKKVSEKNYSLSAGQHQLALPTETLRQGIYFILIRTEKGIRTARFVKQ